MVIFQITTYTYIQKMHTIVKKEKKRRKVLLPTIDLTVYSPRLHNRHGIQRHTHKTRGTRVFVTRYIMDVSRE